MSVDTSGNCTPDITENSAPGTEYDDGPYWDLTYHYYSEDYSGNISVDDVIADWALATANADTFPFVNAMSYVEVCEIAEAPSDLVDKTFNEQTENSWQHVAYNLEMSDCPTSDAFITYYPVEDGTTALPSWLSYDSATRTFTTDTTSTAGTVTIRMYASTDALVSADTEQTFDITLDPFNVAPELTLPATSFTCYAYSSCSFDFSYTDLDVADDHVIVYDHSDGSVIDPLLTTISGTTISFHAPDNSYEGEYTMRI
jgi:hypothetical protein